MLEKIDFNFGPRKHYAKVVYDAAAADKLDEKDNNGDYKPRVVALEKRNATGAQLGDIRKRATANKKQRKVNPKQDNTTIISEPPITTEETNSDFTYYAAYLDAAWHRRFELVRAFQLERGHSCRVPQDFEMESIHLGEWVCHQRQQYKRFTRGCIVADITQKRIDLLNSIGFVWDLKKWEKSIKAAATPENPSHYNQCLEAMWDKKFQLLRAF